MRCASPPPPVVLKLEGGVPASDMRRLWTELARERDAVAEAVLGPVLEKSSLRFWAGMALMRAWASGDLTAKRSC